MRPNSSKPCGRLPLEAAFDGPNLPGLPVGSLRADAGKCLREPWCRVADAGPSAK